jgi:hypothetical protein
MPANEEVGRGDEEKESGDSTTGTSGLFIPPLGLTGFISTLWD